jgi:outer membrane protein assembly factor BamB
MTKPNLLAAFCLALATWSPGVDSVTAGESDWPQWRGPHRDGHAAPQKLLATWPEGGPPLKWTFDQAGTGYSSVSVVDGRLYTLGDRDDACWVICLDAATGQRIWETKISRAGTDDDYLGGWGLGPRCTPTVDGDQLFALSDIGVLASLTKEGKVQWSVDLVSEFQGGIPKWGYSESPLVDGERVVVTPGGSNFMVALNRKNGQKVWASQDVSVEDNGAQYVSIIKGQVGSTGFYVTATKSGLLALDVDSGKELFTDSVTGNAVAVIPTPVLHDKQLYHTSDYGAGNTLLNLSETGIGKLSVESVYHLSGKTMRNQHGGVVLIDGVIYGFTKANGGVWMAQDLASGKTLWEEKIRGNRSGSICYADGNLYCYNDKQASVYLVPASPKGWTVNGKLTLPKQTSLPRGQGAIWTHPVVAEQTLWVRDQELIYAYDIAR